MSAIAAVLTVVGAVQSAWIHVGSHTLLPDTAGQRIRVPVTGGENVAGVDLFVQVGDGGPELVNVGLPPGTEGPKISAVDLLSDTIFSGAGAIQVDHERSGVGQVFFSSAVLAAPPPAPQHVPADGRLVTLTIDTTGFQSGTFELLLGRILPSAENGPLDTRLTTTGGGSIATTIINGVIAIEAQLAGDYSGNGAIDASDYTVWRDTLGSTMDLRADGNGNGVIDDGDYGMWKQNFGVAADADTLTSDVIPEPASVALLLGSLLFLADRRNAQSLDSNKSTDPDLRKRRERPRR